MLSNAQSLKPTTEEITHLAYFIWEKEGRPHGCDMEHWFEAESLLMAATRKELKSLHDIGRQHSQHRVNTGKTVNCRINHFTSKVDA